MVTERMVSDDYRGDLEDAIAVLRPCRELKAMVGFLTRGGGPGGVDRE